MKIVELFTEAFKHRKKPSCMTLSKQLDEHEHAEIMAFSGKKWFDIDVKLLEENFEVINWLSPEAFCYFLPGICCAGIKENSSELIIYDSIINMLDRSPEPTYWDSFFLSRWPLLHKDECKAVQEWVLWLSINNSFYSGSVITRALETLDLVKQGITTFR
ncbi:MAG TPA: hypothetical protein ENJ60_09365 [Aeromonadales bacterium]|nr:hypothetical protein [Aeromonadales bacterium]